MMTNILLSAILITNFVHLIISASIDLNTMKTADDIAAIRKHVFSILLNTNYGK